MEGLWQFAKGLFWVLADNFCISTVEALLATALVGEKVDAR